MSELRYGSLCSGYGGLDMGAQSVLGGKTAWVSDIDKGANKILAHRYDDVPNLGDFTTLDWSTVEPIDVLTAGFPCQPVSNAGKQLGDLDERWLWDDVARAVRDLRPGLVVLENVRGLLTAGAGRLFGRVLGALADLGYDAQWHGLRAADVGAAHGRWRVFIVATDTRGVRHERAGGARYGWTGLADGSGPAPGVNAGRGASYPSRGADDVPDEAKGAASQSATQHPAPGALFGTPSARMWKGSGPVGSKSHDWLMNHRNVEAQVLTLLPTPSVADIQGGRKSRSGERNDELLLNGIAAAERWGDYAAAIARWEHALGRPAPAPTMTSTKGNPQLSPAFVEWLMGLPVGWVTDVPGITRNEALKALGNGVVAQQAAAAVRFLLNAMEVAA